MADEWQLGSRYVVTRQIGSGSMGQVWLGRDVDGHPLAFKLLRPEFAEDPNVVTRFLQERNLLVGLRSPHVIAVHDLVVEGPRLAIVLDYIPGPSLRGLIHQRRNLPPSEVASLGAAMADGLDAVHRAGVLHRDFKPENVLLAETPSGWQPKLVDFGIASIANAAGHGGTASLIGTPQYLAPELGDGQAASAESDLYALGVTLYEMCAGIVPFSSDSPLALLRLHADHAAGRPEGIPEPLWNLIDALMAKNPHERPSSASQVAQALAAMAPEFRGVPAPHPLNDSLPTHALGGASQAVTPPPNAVPPLNSADQHASPPHAGSPVQPGAASAQLPGPAAPPRSQSGVTVALVVLVVLVLIAVCGATYWLMR